MLWMIATAALAAGPTPEACAEAAFRRDAARAGQLHAELTGPARQALEATVARADRLLSACASQPESPPACLTPLAPLAAEEAQHRMARRDAAAALSGQPGLAPLGGQLSDHALAWSRAEVVLRAPDRSALPLDELTARRDASRDAYQATLQAIEARHQDEATFRQVDATWRDAAAAVNRGRCAHARYAAAAGAPPDPACPDKDSASERLGLLRPLAASLDAELQGFIGLHERILTGTLERDTNLDDVIQALADSDRATARPKVLRAGQRARTARTLLLRNAGPELTAPPPGL